MFRAGRSSEKSQHFLLARISAWTSWWVFTLDRSSSDPFSARSCLEGPVLALSLPYMGKESLGSGETV